VTDAPPVLALVAELDAARRLARALRQDEVEATILVGDTRAALRAIHRLDPAVILVQAGLVRGELFKILRDGGLPPVIVMGDVGQARELVSLVDAGALAAVELPAEAGLIGRVLRRGLALHKLCREASVLPAVPDALLAGLQGAETPTDDEGLAWQPVVRADDLGPFGYELSLRPSVPGAPPPLRAPSLQQVASELAAPTPPGAVFLRLAVAGAALQRLGGDEDPLAPDALRIVLQLPAAVESDRPGDLPAVGRRLHDAGYRIALLAPETGTDPLAHLLALRPELVKLAPESWRPAMDDAHRARVLRSLVEMARSLGARVVAEGVDTPAQADFAAEIGCALLQGRLLGVAAPARVWAGASLAHKRRRPR